jgi:hypothetical protein
MKRRAILLSPLALFGSPAQGSITDHRFGRSQVTVETEGEAGAEFANLVDRWITKSAEAVMVYYGRFPVPRLYIQLLTSGPPGVGGGQTFPGDVPLIRIRAGASSTEHDLLNKDWVLVHEMIHLAFPWMNGRHNWMAEGLAVYVESIARVQAGHLKPERIWADFAKMMPRGLPQDGEGGYEVTVNWGRTYWGGAIFCLLADVAIRQQTDSRIGLQHALRAINAVRDFRREWDFAETLAIGDRATGTTVLTTQFAAMAQKSVVTDLAALWRSLGINVVEGGANFDETAPLAGIRRAIETPV